MRVEELPSPVVVHHDSEPPVLDIRLLGQPRIDVSGHEITGEVSKRAIWLIAILAIREGKPIERQRLAGMLWPDSTDDGALHNLRQTLASLRRTFGAAKDCVKTVSPRSIYLDLDGVRVDVIDFDRLCADGSPSALEQAMALYRESLLTGCDEPFVVPWREARSQAFLDAADKLGAQYSTQRNYSAAARVLRKALAEDPYREATCRSLMNSLAEIGEGPSALEICRDFRQRLRKDLGTDISAETKALYRKIRSGITKPGIGRESVRAPHRMPIPLTGLVGREKEIREVSSLLGRCRLVTLTGAGGVGKTRLALAVAEATANQYLDGAWFVDLAPLQDPLTIPSTIAAAMEIHEEAGRAILETIQDRLSGREVLLVFDNCEHVASGVAEAVELLLSSAKGLHVLATSRQSIGVSGELVWRVPSLSMPDAESDPRKSSAQAEAILKSDAVQLFLERSSRHAKADSVNAAELDAIASICRRLDGVPLAIELAAARTRVLSPAEIEARLVDRFALLQSGSRALARHQTLQASMEWSWDLLSDSERWLLMRLCVFRGGCSLGAIESIGASNNRSDTILDDIESLVDRSLLNANRNNGESRFTLLETTRQFAEKRLSDTDEYDRACDEHFYYFLALAKEWDKQRHSDQEAFWFDLFETEHDNFRTALAWSHKSGQHGNAMQMASLLGRFWDTCGHVNEGRQHIETALSYRAHDLTDDMRAHAHTQVGWMATVQRDASAAIEHFGKSIPYFKEIGDKDSTAKGLNCLGCAEIYAGDFDSAKMHFLEAIDLYRDMKMLGGEASVLSNLAEMALQQDDLEAAKGYAEESLRLRRNSTLLDPETLGQFLMVLTLIAVRQGSFEEGYSHITEAIRIFSSAALIVDIPSALQELALVETGLQNWDRAAKLFGASEALSVSKAAPLVEAAARDRAEALEKTRAAMGAAFDRAFDSGRSMSVEEATSFALESSAKLL